jgi:RimJ/RimL family protein N-acetyltransferase
MQRNPMIVDLQKKSPAEKLDTARLGLVRQKEQFADLFFEKIDRDRVWLSRFLTHMKDVTLEAEREFLAGLETAWDNFESFDYALFESETGKLVGGVGTAAINWKHHRVEIGYFVFSGYEGKGMAKEAVTAIEQELFSLGFNRIEIRCNVENVRSRKLAETLGYTFEGIQREDAVENGSFRSTCVFSKLRSDSV